MRNQTMWNKQNREVIAEVIGGISLMGSFVVALWAFSIFADPGKYSLITHIPWQAMLALGFIAVVGIVVSELITRKPSEKVNLIRLRRKNKIHFTW